MYVHDVYMYMTRYIYVYIGISAGVPSGNVDDNKMFSIFWVTVSLTIKGLANWMAVVKRVHEYLDMLRGYGYGTGVGFDTGGGAGGEGLPEWVFREIQQASQMKFGKWVCAL